MEHQKILDVGAGTGRYSVALANEGYDVTAVELYEKYNLWNFKIQGGEPVKALSGKRIETVTVLRMKHLDMTLLLGPMYHLYTFEDKVKALGRSKRVTKKRMVLFLWAYLMNDYGVLMYGFKENMAKKGVWKTG